MFFLSCGYKHWVEFVGNSPVDLKIEKNALYEYFSDADFEFAGQNKSRPFELCKLATLMIKVKCSFNSTHHIVLVQLIIK